MWAEIANTYARAVVGRSPPRARIVYRPTYGGLISPDAEIEKALRESGAEVSRGSAVDAVEPQNMIAITRDAASEANIEAAFAAAARYSHQVPAVVLAIDTPREFDLPQAPGITSLGGMGTIMLFRVARGDFDPRALLQRELEEYFAWVRSGRRLESRPIFFADRARARENFLELVKRAPVTPDVSRMFATAIARDLFEVGDEMDRAIAALIDAFRGDEPRELLSSSSAAASDDDVSTIFSSGSSPSRSVRSSLGRSSLGLGDDWNDDEPETEEGASRALVDHFDTPLPSGVEFARRLNYFEFDVNVEEEVDPVTMAKTRYEVQENCRPVHGDFLRALEDLDPESWSEVRIGGEPLISEAAIARYQDDPDARGTEILDVEVGDVVFERVILNQTKHWSGKFAYAPAAHVYPQPEGFEGAFANVDIDEETGKVTLLRVVRAGEFLTNDYGDEFFGDNAYPRLSLEEVANKPQSPGEEMELIDVMMQHAWSATKAEELGLIKSFAHAAARILLASQESVAGLAFGLCDYPGGAAEIAARARVVAAIRSAETEIISELTEDIMAKTVGETVDVRRMLAEIRNRAVKADDPAALWEAAKREWSDLNDYMDTVRKTDQVLHVQLQQLIVVLDDESARVMRPGYDPFGSVGDPRFGMDYVLPYTASAIRRAAEEMKGDQLEIWKKLFRDSGVDPDKTATWEEARAMAEERESLLSRVAKASERTSMREFVDFWLVYNEFTVADPADPSKRELVYDAKELLKIRETEIEQGEAMRKTRAEEIDAMRETEKAEAEATAERARANSENKASREARREAERLEFDRLGTALAMRRVPPDSPAFDPMSRDTVLELIHYLEKSYPKLFASFDKRARERWRKWKDLANSAFASRAGGGWETTAKHPKFVRDAIKVLAEFEAYELRKHPEKYRKALEDAGLATPKRKKARASKPGSPSAPSPPKARTSNPVSPAKPSSAASPALAIRPRPASEMRGYPSEAVFGAAAKTIERARGDSVFFFYNTRGEGLVEQFGAIFPDAEVLHRPEPGGGGAGGAASPDDVRAQVTHFFVLYGGDADAPRWYRQIAGGLAGRPYLIATRASRDLVDPRALQVPDSDFEMDGEEFWAWRRSAKITIVLD